MMDLLQSLPSLHQVMQIVLASGLKVQMLPLSPQLNHTSLTISQHISQGLVGASLQLVVFPFDLLHYWKEPAGLQHFPSFPRDHIHSGELPS